MNAKMVPTTSATLMAFVTTGRDITSAKKLSSATLDMEISRITSLWHITLQVGAAVRQSQTLTCYMFFANLKFRLTHLSLFLYVHR